MRNGEAKKVQHSLDDIFPKAPGREGRSRRESRKKVVEEENFDSMGLYAQFDINFIASISSGVSEEAF